MYLYGSEHALMDYHLNEGKIKAEAEKVKATEETKPENGLNTN